MWTLLWWVPMLTNGLPLAAQEEEDQGNEPGQEPASSTVDWRAELVRPVRVTAGVIH